MGNLRRIAFKIVVTLDNVSSIPPEDHTLNYKFSRSHFDTLNINNNTLTITGTRSGKPKFEEVFINNQSEIYFQVIKSYVYYAITNGVIPKILEINCFNQNDELEKNYTQDELRNLQVKQDAAELKKIDKQKLKIIFKSTTEGVKYLYAATTLIRSFCSENDNDVFEKLWKSYNSIYRVISSEKQEWQCLNDMGNLMLSSSASFPLSIESVKNLNYDQIRNSSTWVKMLENKFVTRGNIRDREVKFATFLTKYNDKRLVEIALDTIDFKTGFWIDTGLRTTTFTELQNRTQVNTTNDIELVDALCNYHMYYLRNKTLHGEQTDHSFRFIPFNKEEATLKLASKVLYSVVCDLINSHNL